MTLIVFEMTASFRGVLTAFIGTRMWRAIYFGKDAHWSERCHQRLYATRSIYRIPRNSHIACQMSAAPALQFFTVGISRT